MVYIYCNQIYKMKSKLFLLLLLGLIFSCQKEPPQNRISLADLESIYANMHADGVNTDQDMLYGYFFTDKEPTKLKEVSRALEKEGFKEVAIYPNEEGHFWLHVERIETHNPASLFELNKSLYQLADKYEIDAYDGFDIGNKDKTKPVGRQ